VQSILIIEVAYNCSAPRTVTGKITNHDGKKIFENSSKYV
jgi:hypothetical protein